MFRVFIVGVISSALLAGPVVAAEPAMFQPNIYAQFNFGGPVKSSSARFGAQLAINRERLAQAFGNLIPQNNVASSASLLSYVKLEFEQSQGYVLQMLGTSIAGYRFNAELGNDGVLHQNGNNSESSGSWASRNWWKVGLGVVAAGAVAVAAGGGEGGSDNATEPTNTQCQVGSGNVGPVVSPGAPCPGT